MTPRKAFLERNHLPKEEVENTVSQNPKYAYEYARSVGERFPLGEPAILQDAKYAYKYTMNVINREVNGRYEQPVLAERQRYPEAEHIISQNPEYAYKYARYVIGGRWEMGEQAISQSARYSMDYANLVLRGRFYAGEDTIVDSPRSIKYVDKFIKDRWNLLENRILEKVRELPYPIDWNDNQRNREPDTLLLRGVKYAEFLGERWHEFENYLVRSENLDLMVVYATTVIKDRWHEVEPLIMTSGKAIYHYAMGVIKGRWHEAEEVIKRDTRWNGHYLQWVVRGRWPEVKPFMGKDEYNRIVHGWHEYNYDT